MPTPPEISWDVFENVDKATCKLIVPATSLQAYKDAAVWRSFSHIEVDPERTIIYTSADGQIIEPSDAFGAVMVSNTYINGQGYIAFGSEVTSIGDNAFSGCT